MPSDNTHKVYEERYIQHKIKEKTLDLCLETKFSQRQNGYNKAHINR